MNPLTSWFARQPLAVKLLVTVPVLAAAIFWSAIPDGPAAGDAAPSNRPVLATDAPSAQATVAPHHEPRSTDTGLTWVSALRTLVSVAVVLGLIVVSAKGLKHVIANAGQLPGAAGALKVLATSYLPSPNGKGRSAIHLVETSDGRQLLIGATDTSLSLLAEFDDAQRLKLPASQPAAAPFTDLLAAASEKAPEPIQPSQDDLAQRLHRLRQSKLRLEAAV